MVKVTLIRHDKKYAKSISELSSAPQVKDALGLTDEQTSLRGTVDFIEFVHKQEQVGKLYSRVILNEEKDVIGVITLKDIDYSNKICHIGTWIGFPYWGKGYNVKAKAEILHTAFTKLDLKYVFAGARKSNIRSQKAQEKLPYVRLDAQPEFPNEHKKLELQANEPCMLNVIEKEVFLDWYTNNNGIII